MRRPSWRRSKFSSKEPHICTERRTSLRLELASSTKGLSSVPVMSPDGSSFLKLVPVPAQLPVPAPVPAPAPAPAPAFMPSTTHRAPSLRILAASRTISIQTFSTSSPLPRCKTAHLRARLRGTRHNPDRPMARLLPVKARWPRRPWKHRRITRPRQMSIRRSRRQPPLRPQYRPRPLLRRQL